MLKMLIRLNERKINADKKYNLKRICSTIDGIFMKAGFQRMHLGTDTLVYQDNGQAGAFGRLGLIVNTFKRQEWFMDNISAWRMYEDTEDTDPEETDLLKHYRMKQVVGR